jgi:hypothetical protein
MAGGDHGCAPCPASVGQWHRTRHNGASVGLRKKPVNRIITDPNINIKSSSGFKSASPPGLRDTGDSVWCLMIEEKREGTSDAAEGTLSPGEAPGPPCSHGASLFLCLLIRHGSIPFRNTDLLLKET